MYIAEDVKVIIHTVDLENRHIYTFFNVYGWTLEVHEFPNWSTSIESQLDMSWDSYETNPDDADITVYVRRDK